MTRKPRLTIVGSINRDLSVRVETLPRRGETVVGGEFMSLPGGKGANQAVAAARFGGDVAFVGCVGSDAFGDEMLTAFERDRISIDHVRRDTNAPSGVALILVDSTGDNCITVSPGANGLLSPADVDAAEDAIAESDIVLLQLEIPTATAQRAATVAHKHGVRVVLNPAPAVALDEDLLQLIDVFTPNATEAEFYAGIPAATEQGAEAAAAAILRLGPSAVVVTLGSGGAVYCAADGSRGFVPGLAVAAVDSTAAGDVFNGALSVLLAEGASLEDAVRHANSAAALSVTRLGAQDAAPMRGDVASFVESQRTNGILKT